jgi:hypothetical protein
MANVDGNAFIGFCQLLRYRMPLFFVSDALAQAVSLTEPPEDLTVNELHWPMEAMTFVFSHRFIQGYAGADVNFLSVCRIQSGTAYRDAHDRPFGVRIPRVATFYVVRQGNDYEEYVSAYPLEERLSSFFHVKEMNMKGTSEQGFMMVLPATQTEIDRQERMNGLAFKLMLAMTARPELVEQESTERAPSKDRKKGRSFLWNPNFIGRHYRLPTETPRHEGGHASPRMHWRRGHNRMQFHGKGRALRKLIWIEPMLVNSEPDEGPI